jgi:hypothetical protein
LVLDDGNVKSLPGTPLEVIASPGANKAILPAYSVLITSGFATHPYTGADVDGYLSLAAANGSDVHDLAVNDSSIVGITGLDTLLASDGMFPCNVPFNQAFVVGWGILQFAVLSLASYANTAINLKLANGTTTDLGGGNAANTMKVCVAYYVLNLTTGKFE